MTASVQQRAYLREGTVLVGRYTIQEEIGRGGYSVVYRAHDEELGRVLALKLLVPPPASADTVRERMRREVQIVRELAHEHIVPVYDFEDDGEHAFVVMRLIDGGDLAARVEQTGPLDLSSALSMVADIASALTHAHEHGVIHRDVKPQNILLSREGHALLTDFGSARLDDQVTITRTGTVVGTAGYLAPNVAAGKRADARDDVFAMAATLYYALTGEVPTGDASVRQTLQQRHQERSTPVAAAIARALNADPAQRFPTMRAFRAALLRNARVQLQATARCAVCDLPCDADTLVCEWCHEHTRSRDDVVIVVRGDDYATARVPASRAESTLRRVLADGKHAVAVPVDRAWTAIPRATWLLAALVLTGGVSVVSLGATGAAIPGGVIALLLVVSAHLSLTRTRWRAPRGLLPSILAQRIVTTLGTLADGGTARDVFGGLVARVRLFAQLQQRQTRLDPFRESVFELCDAACDVALDVDAVDTVADTNDRKLERARTRAVQRLLSAIDQIESICAFGMAADGEIAFDDATKALRETLVAMRAGLDGLPAGQP